MGIGAAIGAGIGGIASGLGSYLGAQTAAHTAQRGITTMQQMLGQATGYLKPFVKGGKAAENTLLGAMGIPGYTPFSPAGGAFGGGGAAAGWGGVGAPSLLSPFAPTMQQLAATPGYQFTLQQGELATGAPLIAAGLGGSGALGKGLESYASGLAAQTYNQQLQNYMQQNAQAYNMLFGPTQIGAQAAGQAANVTGQMGQSIGSLYGQMGGALGTGIAGLGSGIGQGIAGASMLYGLPTPTGGQLYGAPGGAPGGIGTPTSAAAAMGAVANPLLSSPNAGYSYMNMPQGIPLYGGEGSSYGNYYGGGYYGGY